MVNSSLSNFNLGSGIAHLHQATLGSSGGSGRPEVSICTHAEKKSRFSASRFDRRTGDPVLVLIVITHTATMTAAHTGREV